MERVGTWQRAQSGNDQRKAAKDKKIFALSISDTRTAALRTPGAPSKSGEVVCQGLAWLVVHSYFL